MVEQAFAVGLGGLEHPTVDELRIGGEAALRAGEADRLTDVAAGVRRGETVERMTFGHVADQPSSRVSCAAGIGGASPVRS